jgi:hypothetical protein
MAEGMPTNGKYLEDRRFILEKLDTLTSSIDKLVDTIHDLDKRLVIIETKAVLLGAGSALIVSFGLAVLRYYLLQ